MDELVKLVVEKTGLSEEIARTAVNTVIAYLKGRLPAPIAGQIDGILSGKQDAGNLIQGALGKATDSAGLDDLLKSPFDKK